MLQLDTDQSRIDFEFPNINVTDYPLCTEYFIISGKGYFVTPVQFGLQDVGSFYCSLNLG